jgi:hypothetical protein
VLGYWLTPCWNPFNIVEFSGTPHGPNGRRYVREWRLNLISLTSTLGVSVSGFVIQFHSALFSNNSIVIQYINVYFNVVGELISAARLSVEQPRKDPSHPGALSKMLHPNERQNRSKPVAAVAPTSIKNVHTTTTPNRHRSSNWKGENPSTMRGEKPFQARRHP